MKKISLLMLILLTSNYSMGLIIPQINIETMEEYLAFQYIAENYEEVSIDEGNIRIDEDINESLKNRIVEDFLNEKNKFFKVEKNNKIINQYINENFSEKIFEQTDYTVVLYELTNNEKEEINKLIEETKDYISYASDLRFTSNVSVFIPSYGLYIKDGKKVAEYEAQSGDYCRLFASDLIRIKKEEEISFNILEEDNDRFFYRKSPTESVFMECSTENLNSILQNLKGFFNN